MLGSLVAVFTVLICTFHQYRKGGVVRGFVLFIAAISASAIALNYYEWLAKIMIERKYIVEWAQSAVFTALFIITFTILALLTGKLVSRNVKFTNLIERIGSVVCGICLGLVIAGVLLIAAGMAPLSGNYPYKRFAGPNVNPDKPKKVLLNPDGFVSSIFTSLSTGSFSSQRSFAILHNNFINQIFLNRLEDKLPVIAKEDAIELPSKEAVWYMAENPIDASTGAEVYAAANHNLMTARIGIRPQLASGGTGATFTLSQIRLLCKKSTGTQNLLTGSARSVYPIGYMKMPGKLKRLPLETSITIDGEDFVPDKKQKPIRWLDLVFNVPKDQVPAILEFRQNIIATLPRPLPAEQAPQTASYVPASRCATETAQLVPLSSARVYGLELSAGQKLLMGLKLPVINMAALREFDMLDSPMEIMLESNRISYLRARLVIQKEQRNGRRTASSRIPSDTAHPFAELLRPLPGYRLLSLKCNNPSAGNIIPAEQLPVLAELSGKVHCPVGVFAAGKVDEDTIYQLDYCSLTSSEIANGLLIADDGTVAEAFCEIWLTEEVQNITELYLLYLVEEAGKPIITSVWPGDTKGEAGFTKYEGFRLK